MKNILHWGFILILAFSITSCEKDDTDTTNKSTSINKILPFGASRVQGARPLFESYRFELWKKLIDNNWTFDYIGTKNDFSPYPDYNGLSFDRNHEGRGGWTSGELLAGMADWLDDTGAPDLVLFSSPGGNDALQELPYDKAIENIKAIIDAFQKNNPSVIIIIEQMAPGHTTLMEAKHATYFHNLQEEILSIASEKTTPTSQVIAIDMYTGFTDDMLSDEVHYNTKGAAFIAERYYTILEPILVQ